uniref:Uncharacterized protein n=1 Tax=Arundo donax TaxID=35708 RepID=A0A0A9HXS8_ARUDO
MSQLARFLLDSLYFVILSLHIDCACWNMNSPNSASSQIKTNKNNEFLITRPKNMTQLTENTEC